MVNASVRRRTPVSITSYPLHFRQDALYCYVYYLMQELGKLQGYVPRKWKFAQNLSHYAE